MLSLSAVQLLFVYPFGGNRADGLHGRPLITSNHTRLAHCKKGSEQVSSCLVRGTGIPSRMRLFCLLEFSALYTMCVYQHLRFLLEQLAPKSGAK